MDCNIIHTNHSVSYIFSMRQTLTQESGQESLDCVKCEPGSIGWMEKHIKETETNSSSTEVTALNSCQCPCPPLGSQWPQEAPWVSLASDGGCHSLECERWLEVSWLWQPSADWAARLVTVTLPSNKAPLTQPARAPGRLRAQPGPDTCYIKIKPARHRRPGPNPASLAPKRNVQWNRNVNIITCIINIIITYIYH